MPFTQDTLNNSDWCSRFDCKAVFADIDKTCRNETAPLDRAIAMATGKAQSILRSRYPDNWPFSTPPQELRDAVATIAVYTAMRSRANSGLADLIKLYRDGADSAEKWLREIVANKAELLIPPTPTGAKHNSVYVSRPPSGEHGFTRR